ncbi:STAS domain-containing protein [Streptomyces sp. NPDC001717]|uniref:STAS domain-containing protein n=1 Tax=Streptomyces sp. NPDC001717 TaxID=3364604 RepID=UPI0036C35CD8
MAGQRPQPPGGNGIGVEILEHAVTIRPTGEIDIDTAPALHFALSEALAHASVVKPVAVDCSGLTFCDSSALNVLLAARRAAQGTGTVIRLPAPRRRLQRLLEMTGTRSLFPVDPEPPAGRQVPE